MDEEPRCVRNGRVFQTELEKAVPPACGARAQEECASAEARQASSFWATEESIRGLFRAAPIGIGLVRDRVLLDVSDVLCHMVGYTRDELVGKNARLLYPSEAEYLRVGQVKYAQIAERGTGTVETRWRHKSGKILHIILSSTVADPADPGKGYLFTALDVTAHRLTERALGESEERLRALVRVSPLGVATVDELGNLTECNAALCDILGYSREELLALNFADFTHPEDLEREWPLIRDVWARRRDSYRLEKRYIRRDGREIWVSIVSSVVRDAMGRGRFGFAFVEDITERKRAVEALRQREALLSASERLARVGGWEWTVATQTMFWTDELYRIHDLEPGEIAPGSPAHITRSIQCYDPNDQPKVLEAFQKCCEVGEPYDMVLPFTTTKGRRLWVRLTAQAFVEDGRVARVVGNVWDITEYKQAEDERQRLERQIQQTQKLESLGVLAGGIAHDFNNILMAVLGHAELALREVSPVSAARGSLQEIANAARRAADLCRQMLAYSGRASFACERIDLREVVDEMVHLLRLSISKKAVLNLNLERNLPRIEADPSQIRQVILNLIVNASDAIGDCSGVITISVGATRCDEAYLRKTELHDDLAPGLYVHLEVSDTGCGMDPETRARIFEPFFSTKFTGRGLGLAAVLGIVRAHKGAIKVYSEVGKGTTFKILFPALGVETVGEEPGKAEVVNEWRGQGTILLAEDEESVRALGATLLEHLGFQVIPAEHGREAVRIYRERGREIDLVLLDLTMPHMDGAETFRELRALNPDVRVVLTSGYSSEDVSARFAGKGIAGVLQKPYTFDQLRDLMAGLFPGGAQTGVDHK